MTTPGYGDPYDTLAVFADRDGSDAMVRAGIKRVALDGARLGGSYVKEFQRAFPDRATLTMEHEALVVGLLDCIANNWVSEAARGMRHGVWDHFKGGLYLSTGTAVHAETAAEEVEYISLYHGTKHHRRCAQWNEIVQWPDGRYRSRWIYRGVDLESSEPPSFKTPLSDKLRAHVARTMINVLVPRHADA